MLHHGPICRVNANGTKREVYCTVNVTNGICCSHLSFHDGKNANFECAAMLFRPRFKRNLYAKRPKIRVKNVVNLINSRTSPRAQRSTKLATFKSCGPRPSSAESVPPST